MLGSCHIPDSLKGQLQTFTSEAYLKIIIVIGHIIVFIHLHGFSMCAHERMNWENS